MSQNEFPSSQHVVFSTWKEERTKDFPQILDYREDWRSLGYDVRVTPNADIRLDVERLVQETNRENLLRIFDSLGTTNMQFDFWRFTKLYLDGGVYADADVRPKEEIMQWQQEAQNRKSVVLFEESPSYMANSTFFHVIRPLVSNFQDLPSYASCVVISPGPGAPFFLDLLSQVDPELWEEVREPRRTLMTAGPGLLTKFAKMREDVVFASKHDALDAYVHNSFGTWKSNKTKWFEKYGWYIYPLSSSMMLALIYCGIKHRCRPKKARKNTECFNLVIEERPSSPGFGESNNLVRRKSCQSVQLVPSKEVNVV